MLKLSVLVPVYNAESTIIEILERVNLQKIEGVKIEKEAVLGANVVLTASTKIIDVSGNSPVEYKKIVPSPVYINRWYFLYNYS